MAKKTTSAHAVWTGHLSFSLLSIPVKLFAAARNAGISFNQVHLCKGLALPEGQEDTRPLQVTKTKQQNFCGTCQSVVAYEHLSKGFEIADDKYAVIDPAELKKLEPEKSNTITITGFVAIAEIDPIYFEASYFVALDPKSPAGCKPYELLFQTMKGTGKAGVAKYISRGKEYNVFVRPYGNGIMIHTMFADAEVRMIPEYTTLRDDIQISDAEVKGTRMLLDAMTTTFDPTSLVDNYSVKVEALIESKKDGAVPTGEAKTPRSDDDLMAQLSASLYAAKNAKQTKTTEPQPATETKRKTVKV
jgi:DNA end-binding protein Ku